MTPNDQTQSNTKSVFIVTTNRWIIYSSTNALKESLQQINNSSYHELYSLRSNKPQEPVWIPRYLYVANKSVEFMNYYKFIICYFVFLSFIGGLFQPSGPCKVSPQCNWPMAKFEGLKVIAKKCYRTTNFINKIKVI